MAYRFGLLGYPLSYSLSPQIHQVFLDECGFQGTYELIPVAVNDQTNEQLNVVLQQLRQGDYDGLNVTIPHKQAVRSRLDDLDDQARVVGAVNTIYRTRTGLRGTNTDIEGFLVDLAKLISPTESGTALVLGAGGAARAIAYGLLTSGWQVWIAARRVEQADQILQDLATRAQFTESMRTLAMNEGLNLSSEEAKAIRLVVNATPLGTKGLEMGSPLSSFRGFSEGTCFYDLVYNPPETTFLRQARQQGYPARNGLGMLIHQAALAFECWTGCKITITPELESKIITRIDLNHD
ncbi:MAG: shikimate dehydrogenase [Anaerolineales bacterium]